MADVWKCLDSIMADLWKQPESAMSLLVTKSTERKFRPRTCHGSLVEMLKSTKTRLERK